MQNGYYDDGAGLTKALVDERVIAIPAVVAPAHRNLPPEYLSNPEHIVIERAGARYLAGAAAREQAPTGYSTANTRYTEHDAHTRFYAAMSDLLAPGSHDMRLTVGANVEAERALREQIAAHYRGVHTFRRNGNAYTITVRDVLVTAQPRGAIAYLQAYPPARLKARLGRRRLEESTCVVIDVGNFTTDCIVLRPQRQRDGATRLSEVYRLSFALRFGVQQLRDEVAAIIQDVQGSPAAPELWEIDTALDTRHVVHDGADIDVRERITSARDALWQRAYQDIQRRLEGVRPHYLFVVGGGVTEGTYGPAIEATWGSLPGFAIPDQHPPHEAVVRGYRELAALHWGSVDVAA
jgi:hypothetical protein